MESDCFPPLAFIVKVIHINVYHTLVKVIFLFLLLSATDMQMSVGLMVCSLSLQKRFIEFIVKVVTLPSVNIGSSGSSESVDSSESS